MLRGGGVICAIGFARCGLRERGGLRSAEALPQGGCLIDGMVDRCWIYRGLRDLGGGMTWGDEHERLAFWARLRCWAVSLRPEVESERRARVEERAWRSGSSDRGEDRVVVGRRNCGASNAWADTARMSAQARLGFEDNAYAEASVWFPRLLRLLEQQATALERLCAFEPGIRRSIDDQDYSRLSQLLVERQPLLEEAAGAGQELEPFAERFELLSTSLRREEWGIVETLSARCEAALERVRSACVEHGQILNLQRATLASQLAGVEAGKAAVHAYMRPAGTSTGDFEA